MKYLTIILFFLIACQKETIEPMDVVKDNILLLNGKEIALNLHSVKIHSGIDVSMSNELFEALTFGTEIPEEGKIYDITDFTIPKRYTNVRILNKGFDYYTQNILHLHVETFNDSIYKGRITGTVDDTLRNIVRMEIIFNIKLYSTFISYIIPSF